MKKKKIRKVESEYVAIFCDKCGKELQRPSDIISLMFSGVGYSTYGGAVDSEWEYQLCRHCGTGMKSDLDTPKEKDNE